MANYEKEIFDLEQVLRYLGRSLDYEKEPEAPNFLRLGLSYYRQYFSFCQSLRQTPAFREDPRVVDYLSFQELVAPTQLNDILNFYRQPASGFGGSAGQAPSQAPPPPADTEETSGADQETPPAKPPVPPAAIILSPEKEISSVPSELESLVALYKESQAEKITTDSSHSIAEVVKRARQTWAEKNRLATILQNRDRRSETSDQFFVDHVQPKAGSREAILADVTSAARQAAIYQAVRLHLDPRDPVVDKAVAYLVDLGLSGSVDFTTNLDLASQLVFKFEGQSIDPALNEIDEAVLSWQKALETEPYTDLPDQLEQKIFQAEKTAQDHLSSSSFFSDLEKENPDFTDNLKTAQTKLEVIQTKLLQAFPNPQLLQTITPPLEIHQKEVDQLLRQSDTSTLINSPAGARVEAILRTTDSGNRSLSPEAVHLYSLGLTPDKLQKIVNNPQSPLGAYFQTPEGKTVYQQVHFQLNKIHQSSLGREIAGNLKPLSGLSNTLTVFYNKQSPVVQSVTKIIINPRGTLYSWINKKIGENIGRQLLKNTGNTLSQKLGGFILNEGLKEGLNSFTKATAKKLTLAAAKKLGFTIAGESLTATIALALGIPTAGASLLIGAVLMAGSSFLSYGYHKFQDLTESIYGEKIKARDLLAPLAIAGGAAVTAGAFAFSGFVFIVRTAQVAVVSAFGIIITSLIIIGLYLGATFLVAPMLSTLVQLDSVEKVQYANLAPVTEIIPGCPGDWPVKGSYRITQGPGGKYSHYNPGYDQSVDIGTPVGTPVYSTSDGVVSFTGLSAPYLNTKIVVVDTKLPNGTSFQIIYAHLSFIKVGQGQNIKVGTFIGASGTAGSGAHLHYEYKKISYNQCPAGGLQLAENCSNSTIPGAGKKCVPETSGVFLYTNSGSKK